MDTGRVSGDFMKTSNWTIDNWAFNCGEFSTPLNPAEKSLLKSEYERRDPDHEAPEPQMHTCPLGMNWGAEDFENEVVMIFMPPLWSCFLWRDNPKPTPKNMIPAFAFQSGYIQDGTEGFLGRKNGFNFFKTEQDAARFAPKNSRGKPLVRRGLFQIS